MKRLKKFLKDLLIDPNNIVRTKDEVVRRMYQ